MKFKIGTIDVPTAEEILDGLTKRGVYPRLVTAERAEAEAAQADEDARRRASDHARGAQHVADEAAVGRASEAQVAVALARSRASAALITAYAAALSEARACVEREREAARHAVREEAARRQKPLEKIAAELAPVLEQLRAGELALELLMQREHLPSLDRVIWPTCLSDEALSVNQAEAMSTAK